MTIGLVYAMPGEIETLLTDETRTPIRTEAGVSFYQIRPHIIACCCGVSKVNAAMGAQLLMDDANTPSLLSLPYLGICPANDPLYLRTRSFVLSKHNPYYYEGSSACGIGSPHTPEGYIWPISLCIQGMTSLQPAERAKILRMLLTTHAGTARIHESFDPNQPSAFTREWFAWANSMFGELVFRMHEQKELSPAIRYLIDNDIKSINCMI